MQNLTTYLIFNGDCRKAMEFYDKCLGGELYIMPFSEVPGDIPCGREAAKDMVMHARFSKGNAVLMASDTMPGMPFTQGNNFSVNINCDSNEEIEKLFGALSENGKVDMALHDAFWGSRFGMLTDQFGIHWMFNFEKAKPAS